MRGGRQTAKPAVGRPLDGRVRARSHEALFCRCHTARRSKRQLAPAHSATFLRDWQRLQRWRPGLSSPPDHHTTACESGRSSRSRPTASSVAMKQRPLCFGMQTRLPCALALHERRRSSPKGRNRALAAEGRTAHAEKRTWQSVNRAPAASGRTAHANGQPRASNRVRHRLRQCDARYSTHRAHARPNV